MVQWRGRRQSGNIEDRRGRRPGMMVGGGLGAVLVVIAISLLTGADPSEVASVIQQGAPADEVAAGTPPPDDEQAAFVAVVLADTEDTWNALLPELGRDYEAPRLVLFEQAVSSACGTASSAVGPFYCPLDTKVYLDLSFFRDLDQRFGAPGDFARAYVIAHDATLAAIADDRPQSLAALRRIKGMGPVKVDSYGAEILAIVASAA